MQAKIDIIKGEKSELEASVNTINDYMNEL